MTKGTQVASSQRAYEFGWWTFWSWLGLVIGTLVCLGSYGDLGGFAVLLAIVNVVLCIYMLKFSRIAFIITTVISLNPILWIAHWIYLKNRWEDPRLLENSTARAEHAAGVPTPEPHGPERLKVVSALSSAANVSGTGSASESDEILWEQAMKEADSELRRPGLWAKCFAEAGGVEPAAKARYMAARFGEAKAARVAALKSQEEAQADAAEELRLGRLDEAERAYERLPKGSCPSCEAVIPLSAHICPRCKAMFGSDAAWSIRPLVGSTRT
jgi:hypothetical protein